MTDFPTDEAQIEANEVACQEARAKAGLTPELPDYVECEDGCILYKNGCPFTNPVVTPRTKFIDLLTSTKRSGMPEFLTYLTSETDFFESPASSNNHGNYKYGLLEHSLTVYDNIVAIALLFNLDYKPDTLIIVSLLHDFCKANFYKADTRNVKNEKGEWEKVPYFSIDDKIPLGHGEKSVILIQQYLKLSMDEIMAIRWHMAGYDDTARSYSGNLALNGAMDKFPLIAALHMADMAAVNFKCGDKNDR